MHNKDVFLEQFLKGSLPCRLEYEGKAMEAMFASAEKQALSADSPYSLYLRKLAHPDGRLSATFFLREYENALEWWIRMEALGEYDTDIITDFSYCSLEIEVGKVDGASSTQFPCIHYSNGSHAMFDDFMPMKRNFWPYQEDPYRFCCDGGRSSSGCMPYFNLQTKEKEGVILAIGWSGQWNLDVWRRIREDGQSNICFEAKMDRTHFRLFSGETVEMPHMLMTTWDDCCLEDSFNGFRRFMLEQSPKLDGKTVMPPLSFVTWGGSNAEKHLKNIKRIREEALGADTYWIDAGWYGDGDERSDNEFRETWYYNVGAWQPLEHLYPNGMEEVGLAAEDAGLRFLLWFEMERAVSRLRIVKEHREYFIGPKLPFTWEANYESMRTPYSLMLNLGFEPARKYITELLADMIEKTHMKIFRIDFNYEPLPYWRYADAQDRQGITELKYIEGLYSMLDELLARFPHLVIDDCASGGRRLDYRFCRRTIPLFVTDYLCAADRRDAAMQMVNYGYSRWLPIHGGMAPVKGEDERTYSFRSHLGASVGFDLQFVEFEKNGGREWYQEMIRQAKRSQLFMMADLYALTNVSDSEKDWFVYEMNEKESGKGLLMAFRRKDCATPEVVVEARGIDCGAQYSIEDADSGETQVVSGDELANGFEIRADGRGQSKLLFFEKLS